MENWLSSRFLRQQRLNQTDLGQLRRARQFDINNYERVVNDLTGRLTSSQSQRLAVAQGLGLQTQGLIIGGQRDGRPAPDIAREQRQQQQQQIQESANQAVTKGQSISRAGARLANKNRTGVPFGAEPLEGY